MNAHFIDINILIDLKSKPWIVSKDNPNLPILKIEKHEFNSFKSGIYKNHNNRIQFNGETFWLSNEFMNKVKVKSKNYKIDISKLAISMQEFLNPDIIDDIPFQIDMSIFNSIINTKDDIYVICSKNKKKYYDKQIKKLEEELTSIGLKIKNYYFLSETFYNRNEDDISFTKVKLLLQHLIGLKTEKGKITNEEVKDYQKVYLYDDNKNTIELVKSINIILENLLLESEKDVKLIVKDKIRSKENLVVCKLYTHNKVNKFEETLIPLEFSNVIRTFENFNVKLIKENNDESINTIKDYFCYLTDKWDDMIEGEFPHPNKKSREIKYTFLTRENIKKLKYADISPTYIGRYPLFKERRSPGTGIKPFQEYKWIDNIDKIFFAIYIDLTGPNDMYSTLYEFNEDCETLVSQYNTQFDTELITGYASGDIIKPISHFLIVFYDE
jgi:hypothetical protein